MLIGSLDCDFSRRGYCVFTVLGFNLLGDGLRDVLDPKLRC